MFKNASKTSEPENIEKAYEYAVFLLSLQLRTEGEIRDKMARRGYEASIIHTTIGRLQVQKYLDDERYAEVFLENLKQYKNLGYYGIKKKFLLKKLPSDIIDKVLEAGLSVKEELKIAQRFLKKEGVSATPTDEDEAAAVGPVYSTYDETQSKQKQKITAKLKSRGFRSEVLARLVF